MEPKSHVKGVGHPECTERMARVVDQLSIAILHCEIL